MILHAYSSALLMALVVFANLPAAAATDESGSLQDSGRREASSLAETKERFTPEMMEKVVSRPLAALRKSGLAASRAEFERLIRRVRSKHGSNSIQAADTISAFGVSLYAAGNDLDDAEVMRASLEYLDGAVKAYRSALGPDHPEVALALHSYADVEVLLNKDQPPVAAENAYAESYRIRLLALGQANAETRAVRKMLAQVMGHPSRVRGDPEKLRAVASLYEEMIADAPNEPEDVSPPVLRLSLARIYALNGKPEQALQQVEMVKGQFGAQSDPAQCVLSFVYLEPVAEALRQSGHEAAADTLLPHDSSEVILRCLGVPESADSESA